MAIDTREKLSGAIFPLCPWRTILPEDDGSPTDIDDRRIVAWSYPFPGVVPGPAEYVPQLTVMEVG